MKKRTFYAVDFDQYSETATRFFRTKKQAFAFAQNCGDFHWSIERISMLGVGARSGPSKRAWKKAQSIYYRPNGSKLKNGNSKGCSLDDLKIDREGGIQAPSF